MTDSVHIHPKVERQLTALAKQKQAPAIAAGRANRIIDALIRGVATTKAGLLKKKTDRRVKNCLKFDLGSGFRLICIKKKKILYVMFVGDHDNCDNWLDNYSKKKPPETNLRMRSHPINKRCIPMLEKPEPMKTAFEDPSCFHRITQEELRQVFRGLTG